MKQNTQTKNAEPLQDKQVSSHTPEVKWERELQSLKNAVIGLDLEGYEVCPNHNGFRGKTTYFLKDEKGNSITGSWNYTQINHFIFGYGKAAPRLKAENEKLKADKAELFQMVKDLKNCIKRLTQDNLPQFERDTEAQWEGEAHELLTRINPNYYRNSNEVNQ